MFALIIFICTSSLLVRISTATSVGGVILQNTVWTKANNPYHVIADVQIPFNVTLTIKAGVKIIYDNLGDFEMLVKGYLQVIGTSGQPVIFDGSTATNNIKWMLTFKAANLSQSSIVYAQFIGPKQSAGLLEVPNGIPLNTGELILQYCTFTGTQINTYSTLFNPWIVSAIPALVVKNSTITDSTVSNGGFESFPQFIKLIGNELQNVTLNATAHYNGMGVADCRGGNISIYWRGYNKAYFDINDTRLTNVFVKYLPYYGQQTFFTIRRSVLLNATILLVGLPSDSIENNVNIISSKITVPRAIEMQTGSIQNSTITIFGNSPNTTGVLAGSIFIVNSSIFDFNVGLSIFTYKNPMGSISNSNFYRNSLYNIMNLGNSNVNATGNWWGTKTNVGDTLYDYWKNINYGEIFYNNFALNRIEEQS